MDMKNDREILRKLADSYMQIAVLPVQEEKKRLWKKLNGLNPERPMVMIDQISWSEIVDDELILQCEDAENRMYEQYFRQIIYRWKHFPADYVVEPFVRVKKAINNSGFGIDIMEKTIGEENHEVSSHAYTNLFSGIDDVEKIKMPKISHDLAETKRRMEHASWLFDGIIDVRDEGYSLHISVWDPISTWMSVEGVLYAMIDNPEMLHALAKRVADGHMQSLDQLEEMGLISYDLPLVHCTGAFTDELPAAGFNPEKPRLKDTWCYGLAQMFSTVSPAMFYEYEIVYSRPIMERYGLTYYGCCEPLHDKMDEIKKISNVRKISVSPWANQEISAQEIGKDYVFSRKPNPSFLAMEGFDGEIIKKEFAETLEICKKYNCPSEFILKDISTIRNKPERLSEWEKIAMKAACG